MISSQQSSRFRSSNLLLISLFLIFSVPTFAGTEGSISGTVVDKDGVAISGAKIQVFSKSETLVKETTSSSTGEFSFFPILFGDYYLTAKAQGFDSYRTELHVSSGGVTQVDIQLQTSSAEGKEIVMEVKGKRKVVQTSTSNSSKEVTSQQIEELPQGVNVSLPHLLAATTPGVVQGPFGQTFIRGNHANIQYQIDGVQLPDSQTNTFGDAFTPRNIDHMEVITGGIPAEYGNRLAAVVNIVTKTGTENPQGEVTLNYGSYNTFSPYLVYGGSNSSGNFHYFVSAQYNTTNRGLDTPQPLAETNQYQGGQDAVHDSSNSNNEFVKLDWLPNNDDKLTLIVFNSYTFFQIPNYPSSFRYTDPFFQSGFTDAFSNTNGPGSTPVFNWMPSTTNDTQTQDDAYVEVVWKHTFDTHTFLQNALYYKYSLVNFGNDPTNDLAAAGLIPLANPSSFSENRTVNNFGVKSDFTNRFNERNLLKAGFQLQRSTAAGPIQVISASNNSTTTPIPNTSISTITSNDHSTATGYTESLYVQDDFTIAKPLVLNVGLRVDAFQYYFNQLASGSAQSLDQQVQPRIGLNYFPAEDTKLHIFYGRLFMPAPLENLRDTFNTVYGVKTNTLNYYDIKAEKDDYFEAGVSHQLGNHVLTLNAYYKNATDMLDDTQLLNTSLAAAYNYATGFAYGVEFSIQGKINSQWSDYLNYSWEIAKGQGATGGLFALPPGTVIPSGYLFLDHVQVHTANAGLTYTPDDHFRISVLGLFGSGLRTGPNNSVSLPAHFTMDTTFGYDFHGDSWLSRTKVSLDVLNIFDNVYPITVANGFNASHYAAGRQFFVRLTQEI